MDSMNLCLGQGHWLKKFLKVVDKHANFSSQEDEEGNTFPTKIKSV